MAFRFQLDALLRVRRNQEEELQARLAREERVLRGHQHRLTDLKEQKNAMIVELEIEKKGLIPAVNFIRRQQLISLGDQQLAMQETALLSQDQIVAGVRKELLEAVRNRKMVEVIKERSLRQYKLEVMRQEQADGDEQALLRYGRGENLL